MEKIKELADKIKAQQAIIDSEMDAAEQGHNQARARVIEAEEKQKELCELLASVGLWLAMSNI